MIVTDLYCGKRRIVAAYQGTELIFERDTSHVAIRQQRLDVELDLHGNLVSVRAIPVSAEADISLGMEAEVTTRPIAMASPEAGLSLGVTAEEIHTLDPVPLAQMEGIALEIEADVYVYNKAEIQLHDGVSVELDVQAITGECAPAELSENVSIDLEAQADSPTAALVTHEDSEVQLGVEGEVATPDICPMTAVPTLELGVEGEIYTPDGCLIHGMAGVTLGIEAIVTVLPAAAVAAELEIQLSGEATVELPETEWTYPVQTGTNLFIPQALEVTQNGNVLKIT